MKTIISNQVLDIFSKERIKKNEKLEKTKIIVDYREKNSLVPSKLISLGFDIEFKEMRVGDYLVKNVIIERKTISDFINSMINKRLLKQIEGLKQFQKKLLIIEGFEEQELYSDDLEKNKINPNSIRGFLLSISLKHNIPILFTKNPEDSAKFMKIIANKKEKEISLKSKKKNLNKKEQLQFILEGFPGIGPKTSKKLLKKFGTIQNVINAPKENLEEILGKKTKNFLEIIGKEYVS